MPSIQSFNVLQPPTSGEVEEQLIAALRHGGVFEDMVLLPDQDIPKPEAVTISFRIHQTVHPKEGGMVITGKNDTYPSIRIHAGPDSTKPATATMVVE